MCVCVCYTDNITCSYNGIHDCLYLDVTTTTEFQRMAYIGHLQ